MPRYSAVTSAGREFYVHAKHYAVDGSYITFWLGDRAIMSVLGVSHVREVQDA